MKCRVIAITCLVVCMNEAQSQLKEESSVGCTKDIECTKGQFCNIPSRTCDSCGVWMDQIDNAPKKCKEDAMTTTPEPYGGCKVDEDCDDAHWCFKIERKCVECTTLEDSPDVYRQRCPNQEFSSATTKSVSNTTSTVGTTIDPSTTMMEARTSSTPGSHEQQKPVSVTLEYLLAIGIIVFMVVVLGLVYLCRKLQPWGKNRDFVRTEYLSMGQFFVAIGNATAPQEGQPCDERDKREDSIATGIEETDEKEEEVSKDEEEPIVVQDEAPSPSSLVINEVTGVTSN